MAIVSSAYFGAVVVGMLVARYLGPSKFGLLNYGIAIYGLFNVISNLGLDSLVVRDITLDESGEHLILGSGFWLKAAASVVTTVVAIIAAKLLEPRNTVLIEIVALMSVAYDLPGARRNRFSFFKRKQNRDTRLCHATSPLSSPAWHA